MIFIFGVILLLGIVAVFIFYTASMHGRRRTLSDELNLKLFLVKLSVKSSEGKDVRQEIQVFEQLLGALGSFKKPFVFEVAVPHVGEEIHFYIAVPRSLREAAIRQIQSLWSDAEVTPVDDYTIFNYAGTVSGAWVREKERFVLPIRTYGEVGADTTAPFLGGLSKINEVGEGGAFQFVVRPAPSHLKKELLSSLHVLKKGWKLGDVLKNRGAISASEVGEAFMKGSTKKTKEEKPPMVVDEAAVKALEIKAAKPFFAVNIRVLASAQARDQAESILQGMVAGFSGFTAPYRNDFEIMREKNPESTTAYQFSFREFNEKQALYLNSEELASLFHFPTAFTAIPKINYIKAKEAMPPSELGKDGVLLGMSSFRGEQKEVCLSDDDRRRHLYIVGQTGTGKSTLMMNMVVEDMRRGKGVAIVDPHGDLIDTILGFVPENRKNDVIVFDPSDFTRPMGLNMIEYDAARPEQKTFIVNEMVGIFDKLYDLKVTGGPMFEQYMRNALLLLMEDAVNEPATLMEVARVFTDPLFRKRKLERIHNPTVVDFWEKEATKAGGEAALANMTPYVTSKFNTFTANDYMRVIIGQPRSAFNFRSVMDEGKILLMNLSKGRIGDLNANLLGMIMVGKILMAALSRVDMPEDKRNDFYLYIDEFQNFTTDSIPSILSEARKYRLNLTIAHQFIAQLDEKVRDAVFGNIGSVVSFRVGAQDSEFLVKQFEPVFNQADLMNIDNFNAYVKLLMNGRTTNPFNMKTVRLSGADPRVVVELKDASRRKYGVPREEVEAQIFKRLRE